MIPQSIKVEQHAREEQSYSSVNVDPPVTRITGDEKDANTDVGDAHEAGHTKKDDVLLILAHDFLLKGITDTYCRHLRHIDHY